MAEFLAQKIAFEEGHPLGTSMGLSIVDSPEGCQVVNMFQLINAHPRCIRIMCSDIIMEMKLNDH